jgi:cysteine synthase A
VVVERNAGQCGNVYFVLDLIGNTPLISLEQTTGLQIYAKAEFLNPGGSIKDRIAKNMIEAAEKEGKLRKGMTIIEPTSGNTGIGLALCGIRKGYRVIIVMPENMSEERKKIIKALGAELVLTPKELSVDGAVREAERIASASDEYFVPQQFQNPANPEIHYKSTAVELCEQLGKKIDVYISGIGSGGTLQGVAKYLLEKNPDTKIVAAEPKNVSALLGHEPGLHQIQGIGDGFIPDILDTTIITEVVEVSDEDAINTARELARVQGLLVGTSSGANVWAAKKMAEKYGKDKVIATILADRAERYFSTALI